MEFASLKSYGLAFLCFALAANAHCFCYHVIRLFVSTFALFGNAGLDFRVFYTARGALCHVFMFCCITNHQLSANSEQRIVSSELRGDLSLHLCSITILKYSIFILTAAHGTFKCLKCQFSGTKFSDVL